MLKNIVAAQGVNQKRQAPVNFSQRKAAGQPARFAEAGLPLESRIEGGAGSSRGWPRTFWGPASLADGPAAW